MEHILTKLDQMSNQMEQLKAGMATKQDLERFATKKDLEQFATKRDLEAFATKQDLERFATKQDLEQFATKRDLEAFATKQDLEKFATKQDLQEVHRKLDTIYAQVARNTEQSAQIAELFVRMDKVETDVRLLKKLVAAE